MSCSEWKEYRLEDICEMKYGKMPKKDRISEVGYPIFSGYRIVGYYDEYMYENPEVIVVARGVGGTGDVKLSPPKSYITNLSIALQLNEKIVHKKFMYYKLSNENLRLLDSGSAQSQITINDLKRYIINIPPLKEQEKIANILSSLDDKIELNNEMNKTLEEMAQSIFKRWFVDFEFPNEDGQPYKSSGGEMVESEQGMIPKGWEVKKISELIEVKDGTHASPKVSKEGYPLVTSKHIKGDSIAIDDAKLISEKDYIEVNKRSKVDTGDILISMIGTVGLTYLVQEDNINFAIKNIGLFKTSQNTMLSEYIYLYIKSPNMKSYIESRLAGTTQKYISLGELRNIPIVLPTDNVISRFKDVSRVLLDKKRSNILENEDIKNIRNSLLPKLMIGEIKFN